MDIMTIFYFKSSGKIYSFSSGEQDYFYFGDQAEDFKLILDYLHLEEDVYVFDNIRSFSVDVKERELVYMTPTSKMYKGMR